MKILSMTMIVSIILLLFVSCSKTSTKETSSLELRQFVASEEKTQTSSASFFLFCGNFTSVEKNAAYLKVFAKVNGEYRFLTSPLEDVRIHFNDSLQKPLLKIKCTTNFYEIDKFSDEELCDFVGADKKLFIITCPSSLLPERLLPIALDSLNNK